MVLSQMEHVITPPKKERISFLPCISLRLWQISYTNMMILSEQPWNIQANFLILLGSSTMLTSLPAVLGFWRCLPCIRHRTVAEQLLVSLSTSGTKQLTSSGQFSRTSFDSSGDSILGISRRSFAPVSSEYRLFHRHQSLIVHLFRSSALTEAQYIFLLAASATS